MKTFFFQDSIQFDFVDAKSNGNIMPVDPSNGWQIWRASNKWNIRRISDKKNGYFRCIETRQSTAGWMHLSYPLFFCLFQLLFGLNPSPV